MLYTGGMGSLADELKGVIRGEVDDSPEILEKYSTDASLFKVRPQVAVHPQDAEDVQALVKFVVEKKKAGEKISSRTLREFFESARARLGAKTSDIEFLQAQYSRFRFDPGAHVSPQDVQQIKSAFNRLSQRS